MNTLSESEYKYSSHAEFCCDIEIEYCVTRILLFTFWQSLLSDRTDFHSRKCRVMTLSLSLSFSLRNEPYQNRTLSSKYPDTWGSLLQSKLQVTFRNGTSNYRSLLRKTSYTDKTSYGSPPPCKSSHFVTYIISIVFRNRASNYRALLRKTTHTDEASYGSPPPCKSSHFISYIISVIFFCYGYSATLQGSLDWNGVELRCSPSFLIQKIDNTQINTQRFEIDKSIHKDRQYTNQYTMIWK